MKPNNFTTATLLGIVFLIATNAYPQLAGEFDFYKEKYPNTHMVRLNQETNVLLEIKKGIIDVTQERIEENLFLDESALYGSKKSIRFSSFFEMDKIEASTLIPNKNKYTELKVSKFTEKDERERFFHDDTKSLNFIYPDLCKGAKTTLKYSEKVKNPRFLSPFYFGDYVPVVNNKFTIVADKDITLAFKEFNTENYEITFNETTKGRNRVYTWELKDLHEFDDENNAPTFKKVIPHIIPMVTSYKVNGNAVTVLDGVEDLYKWYYSLIKDINQEEEDPELVHLVNQLTANKENDLEKVKALYYWTQSNIKYIAFEYALGGFIPREANAVFQKKYGDCKDNTSILHRMLEIAGIEGHYTWIGTRSIPYSYNEVPTPLVDNHMILAYEYEGETYFLDATGRYLPFDFPSSFIQGKEALVAQSNNTYTIETVPVIPAEKNAFVEVNRISIEDNILKGTATTEISGYIKVDFTNNMENLNSKEKTLEFYNQQFAKGNNKFLIDRFEETNKFDYDKNLIVDYSFSVDDYVKNLGDEMYVNLNLNKDISAYRTKKDRKYDLELDYGKHFSTTTILDIPEGYEVAFVPQNLSLETPYLSASVNYEVENNRITYSHNIIQNFLTVTPTQQKEINHLVKQVEKSYKEIIILKKI